MNKTMAWVAAALLLACTTSCLEGGSNSVESTTVGIIRRESKEGKMVMDNPFPYGPFYSPTLSKLNEGACVLVHFTLDRDAAENSSTVVRSRGYSTVTISAQAEVEKYRIARFSDPGAPDTGKVLKDEVPIKNPVNLVRGYVRGYLFVEHVLNQPSDQRNEWYLTYNPDAKPRRISGNTPTTSISVPPSARPVQRPLSTWLSTAPISSRATSRRSLARRKAAATTKPFTYASTTSQVSKTVSQSGQESNEQCRSRFLTSLATKADDR